MDKLLKNFFSALLFCLCLSVHLSAQCPDEDIDFIDVDVTNCLGTFDFTGQLCPTDQIFFELEQNILVPPNTEIIWYKDTDSDVDFIPSNIIGVSEITTNPTSVSPCMPCPELLGIMVDACQGTQNGVNYGPEPNNEFVVIGSGGGFNTSELSLNYDAANNFEPGGTPPGSNGDISPGGFCNLTFPTTSIISNVLQSVNCVDVFAAGPNTDIPAGAIFLIFTSCAATPFYDFDALCANGAPIYVAQSTCCRTIGAFTNGSDSGFRTTILDIDCGCQTVISHDTGNPILQSIPPTTGGGIVYFDINGNLIYELTTCVAPPVELIPLPAVTSNVAPFSYTVSAEDCGSTYTIQGLLSPTFAGCDESVTPTFVFTVDCTEPDLAEAEICIGQSLDLDEIIDPNYTNGVWLGPNGTQINEFSPSSIGEQELTFVSFECCIIPSTTTVNVTEGTSVMVFPDTIICPGQAEINLDGLILETSIPIGSWTGDGVNGNTFDPSNFQDETILISFDPEECGPTSLVEIIIASAPELLYRDTICRSDSITINGLVYNFSSNNGTQFIEANMGCDTALNIQIDFFDQAESIFIDSICNGQEIMVGDSIFNADKLSGLVVFSGMSSDGCDSLVNVDLILKAAPPANMFVQAICPGDSIEIGGVFYHQDFLTGSETLSGVNGCDSTINVQLTLIDDAVHNINLSLCANRDTIINSVMYSADNPNGRDTIPNAAFNGCDSILVVNIDILTEAMGTTIRNEICIGDGFELAIGDQVFNEDNPSGFGILTGSNGCDSIIPVDLVVVQNIAGPDYFGSFCEDSNFSITFGNETFDRNNTSGVARLQAENGCDSVFLVSLFFSGDIIGDDFTTSECSGSDFEVQFGNQTFNEANPTGTATIQTSEGCDSIFQVNLVFTPSIQGPDFIATDCVNSGLEVTFGNDTFNEANPTGTATLISAAGCDSTFNVILTFQDEVQGPDFTATDCVNSGLEVTFGNDTFNEANPTGTATLISAAGCDSIFNVILTFQDQVQGPDFAATDCVNSGLEVTFGNDTFNEANPTGTATLISAAGCDSTFNIILTFLNEVQGPNFMATDCVNSGLEVTFGNDTFNEANPTGRATLISSAGCDSTFNVILTFQDEVQGPNFTATDCVNSGLEVTFGNDTFNEANPTGTATLISAAGCDSTFNVILTFQDEVQGPDFMASDCVNSGLEVTFGNDIFNEANPTGTATLISSAGCDSTFNVILTFQDQVQGPDFLATDCVNSGLEVTFGNDTFNEANPTGTATLISAAGCDSIFNVILTFQDQVQGPDFTATDCVNSGLEVTFGNDTFNEANPTGTATLISAAGCDSTFNVILTFQDEVQGPDFMATDCVNSGLEVTFGNDTFNEANPTGTATLISAAGCDSTFNIILTFQNEVQGPDFLATDCVNSGLEVTFGNDTFNEANPTGTATLISSAGCDSTFNVILTFQDEVQGPDFTATDCVNSGLEVTFGNDTFNEANPTGTATLISAAGCDSTFNVILTFQDQVQGPDFMATDCVNSGLEVTFGNNTFNEANPTGMATLISAAGCDSIFNVALTFHESSINELERTFCSGSSLFINVGTTIFNENNPTGTVTLANQNYLGCDSIVNVNLTYEEFSITLIGEDAICEGDTAIITVVTNSTESFDLSVENTFFEEENFLNIQNGFQFEVAPLSSTGYFITNADNSNCSLNIENSILNLEVSEINVTLFPTDANGASLDCSDESEATIEAVVEGGIGDIQYLWNQGGTTSVIENQPFGNYNIVVTDSAGCTDSESVELAGNSIELDYTLEQIGCDGGIGIFSILGIQGGASDQYSITLNDQFSPLSQPDFPVIFSLEPGQHIISVVDEFGCSKEEMVEIIPTDPQDIFLTATESQGIALGESIQLNILGNFSLDSIVWSPAGSLSCSDCPNPTATPTETTTYQVSAFDNTGCSATTNVVIKIDGKSSVYIPNAFSPNGDGLNELFHVFGGADVAMVRKLSIFDRWGHQLFYAENIPPNNPQFGWDGIYKGEPMRPDVFVYFGVIELIDGFLLEVEGNVTLIR